MTLKESLVEVLTLERTLTELDHVRLLNLLRRDARGDGSPGRTLAVCRNLDNNQIAVMTARISRITRGYSR